MMEPTHSTGAETGSSSGLAQKRAEWKIRHLQASKAEQSWGVGKTHKTFKDAAILIIAANRFGATAKERAANVAGSGAAGLAQKRAERKIKHLQTAVGNAKNPGDLGEPHEGNGLNSSNGSTNSLGSAITATATKADDDQSWTKKLLHFFDSGEKAGECKGTKSKTLGIHSNKANWLVKQAQQRKASICLPGKVDSTP
eukprot:CAMPEP_0198200384 /NCGR_PEP_ID=MMETSP1445-20131203/3408_1 /TAXON_ID=36898 /ORGANISM="Pyramimonas sp., Strain CCMP2087" /LENGTH=197 /DNA_ID=CAMNT_0043870439 /DNA_START=367 /DNA_END=957 /DNA_ORIENTATION=+